MSTGTQDLVERSLAGDRSAFEQLIEPLVEQGYRLACGMLLDRDEAEDAVQEAALKAWLKLRQLPDRGRPPAVVPDDRRQPLPGRAAQPLVVGPGDVMASRLPDDRIREACRPPTPPSAAQNRVFVTNR
jgi:hypothetical protein